MGKALISKQSLVVVLLFLIAFTLRWGYAVNTRIIEPLRADAGAYTMIAQNLAHDHLFTSKADHHGQPSHEARPPGYPFFLALIVSLTASLPSFYSSTLLVQCVLGAITVILAYFLAGYLLPRTWALLVALLVAFSPHMIVMSSYVLSESLFTFLLLLSILLTVWACRKKTIWSFLLAGAVMGLAIFVRPVLAIFPLLCLPVIYSAIKDVGQHRIRTAITVFILASYLLLAAWTSWRTLTLGADTTQAGQLKGALICGFYPDITYKDIPGMPYREDPDYQKFADMDYPGLFMHVLDQIHAEPTRYLSWWLVGKPMMYWSWKVEFNDGINFYPVEYSWFDSNSAMGALRSIMVGIHPFLVILALISIGLFFCNRTLQPTARVAYLLSFILLGHFTLIFMVLAPFCRYALPLGPGLYLMSVFALWKVSCKIKEYMSRNYLQPQNG